MKPKKLHTKELYRVQALDRALNILDCFTFKGREMSLSEIIQTTGLNKTTAKRLVSNLTDRGYLKRDPDSKRYELGLRLFELGGIVFSSFSVRKAAAPYISRLQNEIGATALLGTVMEDHLVYIDKREGSGMIKISSDIGWRRSLHYGMLGMTLMAHSSPEKVRDILKTYPLEAYTPFSITSEDAYILRLEKIRRDGFIMEREEAVEGIMGIAAPIRDYSRRVVAALGVALPVVQGGKDDEILRIVGLVRKACDEISYDLGYLKI
jgi:DNA-binding IclR family transcriptional regulator